MTESEHIIDRMSPLEWRKLLALVPDLRVPAGCERLRLCIHKVWDGFERGLEADDRHRRRQAKAGRCLHRKSGRRERKEINDERPDRRPRPS